MATFLSRTYIPQERKQDTNFPLLAQVMQMKQGRYDANRAQIQQTLDAFGLQSQQVLRDEDKEYIAAKLSDITSQINNYGSKDLSQSGITENLMSSIRTAASDPFIQNAIQISQNVNNFQTGVAKLKEKNPELYSDINYQYALESAGLKDYMEGKTNTIGDLNYIEYTDVNKELKDIAENLDKYASVVKQTTPDGMYFVTQEGKKLSKGRIRQIAEMQLSDKAKRQMQVNSWANFETRMSPDEISKSFIGLRDRKLQNIDGQIAQLKVDVENTNDPNKKILLQKQLQSYESYRKQEKEVYDNYIDSNNTSAMAFSLEKETLLDNFSNVYAPTFSINTTYSENTAFFKEEKLKADAIKSASKRDTDNNGIPDIEATKIPTEYTSTELYGETFEKATTYERNYKTKVQSIFNNLTPEQKIAAEDYLKENNISEEDREDGLMDYFDEKSSESSNIVSISDIEEARMMQTISSENYNRYNTATKQAYNNIEAKNLKDLYNVSISSRNSIKTFDDKGNVVKLSDYLKTKGINSYKDFQNNQSIQEKLWRQYYADMYLSSESPTLNTLGNIQSALGSVYTSPELMAKGAVNKFKSSQSGQIYLNRLSDIMGSEKNAKDYIEKIREKGMYDTNKNIDRFTNIPAMTPFQIFNRDNSFEDDSEGRNIVTQDALEYEAGNLLSKDYMGVSDRGVRVNVDTDAHKRISAIVADPSIVSSEEGSTVFGANKNTPFSMRLLQPGFVEISQTKSGTKDGQPISSLERAVIGLENIPDDIKAQINFGEPKEEYTVNNFPRVNSKVSYINSNDIKRINDLSNNVFYGDKAMAYQTTKEESSGMFFRRYPNLLGTYEQPTEVGEILNNVINTENLILSTNKTDGQIYPEIRYRQGNIDIPIYTFREPLYQENLTSQFKIMKYAPQLYVNRYLDFVLQKIALGTYSEDYKTLQRLYGSTQQ